MGFRGAKAIEKGIFLSPALGTDSVYELVKDDGYDDGLAVRCVESKKLYDTSVLSAPTLAQIAAQHNGFVREVCAWLVTNGANNPDQRVVAISEVRRITAQDYSDADLDTDIAWIRDNDLSQRLHVLGKHLDEQRRQRLVQLAAKVGAANGGLTESDAQFIELLGSGLKLDASAVESAVVSALQGVSNVEAA